jgi:REP element-mobilizing transposase RayT
MGRLARRRLGRGVYHVYNRAHGGAWVLAEPELKRQFLDRLVRFLPRQEVQVYHWAIMGNHFHLAAEALTTRALSGWLQRVCRSYSRWYHRERGGYGYLWQGRYRSVLVEKDGYLPRLGRYIERNPVRVGVTGVVKAWAYEWSSARHYAQGAADPLVALRRLLLLSEHGRGGGPATADLPAVPARRAGACDRGGAVPGAGASGGFGRLPGQPAARGRSPDRSRSRPAAEG